MKFSDNAICSVNMEEDSIQEELDKLQDWNNRNGMNLNNPKGEVRHFRTHNFSPSRKLWKKTWEWIIWSLDGTIRDVPVENISMVLESVRWGTSSKDKYQIISTGNEEVPIQKSHTFLQQSSIYPQHVVKRELTSLWKLVQRGDWGDWRQHPRRALLDLTSFTAHTELWHTAW